MDVDDASPRLKWDEANLYLTEQDRGMTMKIDEPKTPYVKQYDPMEDEEEMAALNAKGLVVDELDELKKGDSPSVSQAGANGRGRGNEIPDLDIGEAEEPTTRSESSEKRVIVDDGMASQDGSISGHGEVEEESMSAEARRKHREFEDRRKRHYEIPQGVLK